MKPSLTIDLVAPEGNVFALIGKACSTLELAGQPVRAKALRQWFKTVPPQGGISYDDVRHMVEQYCEVTWLNDPLPPDRTAAVRQMLTSMSAALGPVEAGTPYLVTYDYVESGRVQRCGFLCTAENVRAAAEQFWGQHPGEWFHLISVHDGSIEAFWQERQGTFVTIPERENRELE